MLIKFKAPDPRAGMVAQMDSHRGHDLVASGAADVVDESGASEPAAPSAEPAPVSVPATASPKRRGKRA